MFDLFIAIFGIMKTTLLEAAVSKAAKCVDNFENCGQRKRVLLLLRTGKMLNNYITKYTWTFEKIHY